MSTKDKWVRRFSVDESAKHKNGFTIYKITSVLFPIESPETVTVISVWKRYSDVQQLHKSMRSLHAGLHLRGTFPTLSRYSYFKRFQKEVIEDRSKTIKNLLEFIAEHRLLFTSTDFVNFLQTGYPEPPPSGVGVINAIRSSLHLPIEETPPLEYQTSDDDARSPIHTARQSQSPLNANTSTVDEPDISQIPIYEASDVEIRKSPTTDHRLKTADSFESLNSLDSINSDLYDELNKVTIDRSRPSVKVLPDLINFDVPSTSKFEDYHTMPKKVENTEDTVSLNSTVYSEDRRSSSKSSLYSKKSVLSLSNVECKTKTEDSYVFEAGYMLNLAARCEDIGDYSRAFECYKSGIEKMLIGVQSDSDPQRRTLIKEKTNKYLSYAEAIYKNHLCDAEQTLLSDSDVTAASRAMHCPLPISMLKRQYAELSLYKVLAVIGSSVMRVLHRHERAWYAMKVIQKVPHNLTEFDEYFLQHTNETRQPVLPTNIPYMVPLQAYIESNNLIFLILSYAPGQKLLDFIKNYVKSIPNTPAREVNLENVFSEPLKQRKIDIQNENVQYRVETTDKIDFQTEIIDAIDNNTENVNNNAETSVDMSINELVLNSQKLLLNVDKVLSDETKASDSVEVKVSDVNIEVIDESDSEVGKEERRVVVIPTFMRVTPCPRDVLPPSTLCKWGAEILTALESLHNSGVICRDLNPTNILLGNHGQIILTYFISYPGLDMCLSKVQRQAKLGHVNMYIAPELYGNTFVDADRDEMYDRVCDYWSFGAVMYELLCGVPLSYYHRSVFTTHTILQLPDGLSVEMESLLTQLLTYDPAERLGSGKDGIQEIKQHPYFKHIDWQYIYDSWIVPD